MTKRFEGIQPKVRIPLKRYTNVLYKNRLENYRADFDETWNVDYGYTAYLHIDVIFFVGRIRGVLPPEGYQNQLLLIKCRVLC